jgi:hypothetical protein
METKVVPQAGLSWQKGCDPAEQFLGELKKHRVADVEFLIDTIGISLPLQSPI